MTTKPFTQLKVLTTSLVHVLDQPVCIKHSSKTKGLTQDQSSGITEVLSTISVRGGNGLVIQSCPTLCDPRTIVCQAYLSMRLPRQEYWSGLPFLSPGILLTKGFNQGSWIICGFFTDWATREVTLWTVAC